MRAFLTLFSAVLLSSAAQAGQDCEFLNASDLSEEDISIMVSVRPIQPTSTDTRLARETPLPLADHANDPRACYLLILTNKSGSEPVMKRVDCEAGEAITTSQTRQPGLAG